MNIIDFLTAKPVLIGLHLGFAIVGIDLFLWLLGEIRANVGSIARRTLIATGGLLAFAGSWIVGGYYYVVYYGPLVKPVIKAGSAPWAHGIAMEAKEHIFLFVFPLAVTMLLLSRLDASTLQSLNLKKPASLLALFLAGIGLLMGLLGFMISAAARWGMI